MLGVSSTDSLAHFAIADVLLRRSVYPLTCAEECGKRLEAIRFQILERTEIGGPSGPPLHLSRSVSLGQGLSCYDQQIDKLVNEKGLAAHDCGSASSVSGSSA